VSKWSQLVKLTEISFNLVQFFEFVYRLQYSNGSQSQNSNLVAFAIKIKRLINHQQ